MRHSEAQSVDFSACRLVMREKSPLRSLVEHKRQEIRFLEFDNLTQYGIYEMNLRLFSGSGDQGGFAIPSKMKENK